MSLKDACWLGGRHESAEVEGLGRTRAGWRRCTDVRGVLATMDEVVLERHWRASQRLCWTGGPPLRLPSSRRAVGTSGQFCRTGRRFSARPCARRSPAALGTNWTASRRVLSRLARRRRTGLVAVGVATLQSGLSGEVVEPWLGGWSTWAWLLVLPSLLVRFSVGSAEWARASCRGPGPGRCCWLRRSPTRWASTTRGRGGRQPQGHSWPRPVCASSRPRRGRPGHGPAAAEAHRGRRHVVNRVDPLPTALFLRDLRAGTNCGRGTSGVVTHPARTDRGLFGTGRRRRHRTPLNAADHAGGRGVSAGPSGYLAPTTWGCRLTRRRGNRGCREERSLVPWAQRRANAGTVRARGCLLRPARGPPADVPRLRRGGARAR